MEELKLLEQHYYELALLLRNTKIKTIEFTPAEIGAMFELKENELGPFIWYLEHAFLEGTQQGETLIISPAKVLEQLEQSRIMNQVPALLKRYDKTIGTFQLLTRLRDVLDNEFDYLSQAQARAVIIRNLQLPLSSSDRNNISKIRKKLEGYRKMVEAFEGALGRRDGESVDQMMMVNLRKTPREVIQQLEYGLRFYCYECNTQIAFPENQDFVRPPVHHGKPMSISWNAKFPVSESNQGIQELKSAISDPNYLRNTPEGMRVNQPLDTTGGKHQPHLYCSACQTRFEIDKELWKQINRTDGRVPMPEHHGQEMELRINSQEFMDRVVGIGQELVKQSLSEVGAFYICQVCGHIQPAGEGEPPKHHDQLMQRFVKS